MRNERAVNKPKRGHYVYVLTNASLPNIVKVGMTTRTPHERARELSTTGLPTPFVVHSYRAVRDAHGAEAAVHHLLRKSRTSDNREFFNVTPDAALAAIDKVIARPAHRPAPKPRANPSVPSVPSVPSIGKPTRSAEELATIQREYMESVHKRIADREAERLACPVVSEVVPEPVVPQHVQAVAPEPRGYTIVCVLIMCACFAISKLV